MWKKIPGTKDILPEEAYSWQKIEELTRRIFSLYNYQEIRPPIIEEESLFNRSLGKNTEIVRKQMFVIRNKEDLYALRPEGTASIVRAYIENNLDKQMSFRKFYYLGPMFRLERPQKGRLRQFHHIGCEAIGSSDADLDVELISLADKILEGLSIADYQIQLNSLGCAKDKTTLAKILQKELKAKTKKLCPDCQNRFKTNTLRVLDCKKETCQEIIRKLNLQDTHLCSECKLHFAKVKAGLDLLGVNYEVIPYLVRGLDYYTRTVFEIKHPALGAQDALAAGGRYDNLVRELGGPDVGAMGFALGMERLLLVRNQKPETRSQNLVYIISLGEEAKKESLKLLAELRQNGIPADTDYEGKSLKGALRAANDLGVRYVLIIGENELKKNVVTLKDMTSGEQREIKQTELISYLTERLHKVP
ncbi:MAG: histidine--tRNA ligase [Candidatus Omnitrophica bacterium]|nr:histidine--tRNA ligase [Candidatus Omnitrophota bacterium]